MLAKDAIRFGTPRVNSCIDGRDKFTFFKREVKQNVCYTNGG